VKKAEALARIGQVVTIKGGAYSTPTPAIILEVGGWERHSGWGRVWCFRRTDSMKVAVARAWIDQWLPDAVPLNTLSTETPEEAAARIEEEAEARRQEAAARHSAWHDLQARAEAATRLAESLAGVEVVR
jgi:hypothetical protein